MKEDSKRMISSKDLQDLRDLVRLAKEVQTKVEELVEQRQTIRIKLVGLFILLTLLISLLMFVLNEAGKGVKGSDISGLFVAVIVGLAGGLWLSLNEVRRAAKNAKDLRLYSEQLNRLVLLMDSKLSQEVLASLTLLERAMMEIQLAQFSMKRSH